MLVVVIDDDADVLEVHRAFLEAGGYEVRTASCGVSGVRLVRETLPSAVVCDMCMPGLSGQEVILLLKSQPATSHIPVVVVTGHCEEEFVGIGDAFMRKPVLCAELLMKVEALTIKRLELKPAIC